MMAKKPGSEEVVRVRRLFSAARFDDLIQEGDMTAIKLHFGERGNESYVKPVFVRQVADAVKGSGGRPFLTDTATLYRGSRENAVDHLRTAMEHGFGFSAAQAPLIIA
ncbi:MAG: DUF362 domain-containing protein, partial [Methanothrix sp.]